MKKRINNGQSDGFNPENQPLVRRANTMSSRETLEIRSECQKLYEIAVVETSVTINDSNPASTVSIEESPLDNTYLEPNGKPNEVQHDDLRNGIIYKQGQYLTAEHC